MGTGSLQEQVNLVKTSAASAVAFEHQVWPLPDHQDEAQPVSQQDPSWAMFPDLPASRSLLLMAQASAQRVLHPWWVAVVLPPVMKAIANAIREAEPNGLVEETRTRT